MTGSLTPLLLNKSELLKLGFTPALIASLLGNKPDKVEHCKRGSYRWVKHLYTRDRVVAAMKDPAFLAHLEKRKARAAAASQRISDIPRKYKSWKDALPEACAGMFSLNRYAKYERCSPLSRQEIYHL